MRNNYRRGMSCRTRFTLFLLLLFISVLLGVVYIPSFGKELVSVGKGLALRGLLSLSASTPVSAASSSSVSSTGTSILGRPSLSVSFIDNVLALAQSPAQGTGQTFYTESVRTGIDDAYPLAIFWHESNFGLAGAAVDTRNPGNIICVGFSSCLGRFRLYPTWSAGVQDLYQLLANEYLPRHLTTLESILQVYAPTSDGNSPSDYVAAVKASVALWRQQMAQGVQG